MHYRYSPPSQATSKNAPGVSDRGRGVLSHQAFLGENLDTDRL
ncbi:hypothetical protein [Mycolicibacter arupensis]